MNKSILVDGEKLRELRSRKGYLTIESFADEFSPFHRETGASFQEAWDKSEAAQRLVNLIYRELKIQKDEAQNFALKFKQYRPLAHVSFNKIAQLESPKGPKKTALLKAKAIAACLDVEPEELLQLGGSITQPSQNQTDSVARKTSPGDWNEDEDDRESLLKFILSLPGLEFDSEKLLALFKENSQGLRLKLEWGTEQLLHSALLKKITSMDEGRSGAESILHAGQILQRFSLKEHEIQNTVVPSEAIILAAACFGTHPSFLLKPGSIEREVVSLFEDRIEHGDTSP